MWSTSSFRGRYSSYNFLALSVARARSSSACLIVASICKHSTLFDCGFCPQTQHTVSLWLLSANTTHCFIVASACKHSTLFHSSLWLLPANTAHCFIMASVCKHNTLFHCGFCLQTQHTVSLWLMSANTAQPDSVTVVFICQHIELFDCFFHLHTQHTEHGFHLQTHSLRFTHLVTVASINLQTQHTDCSSFCKHSTLVVTSKVAQNCKHYIVIGCGFPLQTQHIATGQVK